MTRLTTLAIVAAFAGTMTLASVADAGAQGKRSSKVGKLRQAGKISKKSVASKTSKPARKVKNYDFMADEIDGDRVRPDGTSIFGIQNVKHDSLIRLRSEFIAEILKSAEML